MIEKKYYEIKIPEEEILAFKYQKIKLTIQLKICKLLKQDYGDFWVDDILITNYNETIMMDKNKKGYIVRCYLDIIENLKTKKLLKEIEERLKIGL